MDIECEGLGFKVFVNCWIWRVCGLGLWVLMAIIFSGGMGLAFESYWTWRQTNDRHCDECPQIWKLQMGSMGKICRSNETCGRIDILWKEYFRDPLLWFDNRITKVSGLVSGCACARACVWEREIWNGTLTDLRERGRVRDCIGNFNHYLAWANSYSQSSLISFGTLLPPLWFWFQYH